MFGFNALNGVDGKSRVKKAKKHLAGIDISTGRSYNMDNKSALAHENFIPKETIP